MENASKALIIAGSILITIVVISLGVLIFNNFGGTARRMANLDEQEVTSFNSKIKPYMGTSVIGSQVRALIQYAISVDQNAISKGDNVKRISVYLGSGVGNPIVKLGAGDTAVTGSGINTILTNKTYSVVGNYDSNGLITTINVTQN